MNKFTLELILQPNQNYGTNGSIELGVVNHVKKYIDRFLYKRNLLPGAIGLDYISNEDLDSDRSLQIVNRSYTVRANSQQIARYASEWDFTRARSYTSSYKDILATNKTYIDRGGQVHPLFWKHLLEPGANNLVINKVTNLGTDKVETGYLFEREEGRLYTSFRNSYNQNTGTYELYFVTYNIDNGQGYNELLDLRPAVEEATWEDIDLDTGFLVDTYPTWYRSEASGGWLYNFSQPGPWYIKPITASLIQPLSPSGDDSRSPWFLRFTAGDVIAWANSQQRRYKVTEYDQQSYVPYKPYRFQIQDKLRHVNENVLQTRRESIRLDTSSSLDIQILVYNSDNQLVKAYSTDQDLNGIRYSDTQVFFEVDKISGVDESTGLIKLATKVYSQYTYYGNYYYKSTDYELTSLALNPIYNKKMKDHIAVFYIIPDIDDSDTSIHWLLIDAGGKIVDCSQGDDGIVYPNLKLLNSDTTYNSNTIIGSSYISDFIPTYTAGQNNTYGYMLLAECSVNHLAIKENMQVVDIRTKDYFGTDYQDLKYVFTRNPKLLHSFYGFGPDGLTVPRNKVIIVQPSLALLEDYGGNFSEEQVENYLKENVPSSTQVIIDWSYPACEFSCQSTTAQEVDITCNWEGDDLTYKFYRHELGIDTGTLIDTQVDPVEGNVVFTDTGLDSGTVYTYSVTITSNGVEYPTGNKISVKVK